ncbi:hypothetical protein BS17DRAFT_164352 [Gyrodon lividus]|nr:hypothetical protein BS17DRAFT_164352 [Gyrodon lividus]
MLCHLHVHDPLFERDDPSSGDHTGRHVHIPASFSSASRLSGTSLCNLRYICSIHVKTSISPILESRILGAGTRYWDNLASHARSDPETIEK